MVKPDTTVKVEEGEVRVKRVNGPTLIYYRDRKVINERQYSAGNTLYTLHFYGYQKPLGVKQQKLFPDSARPYLEVTENRIDSKTRYEKARRYIEKKEGDSTAHLLSAVICWDETIPAFLCKNSLPMHGKSVMRHLDMLRRGLDAMNEYLLQEKALDLGE